MGAPDRPEGVLDERKISAARLAIAAKLPYLASALFALPVVARPGSGTAGIESDWRIVADPDVVDALDALELGKVLVHLLSHVLRDHALRAEEALAKGLLSRDVWLLAADVEVNDDLRDAGFLSGMAPDLPADIGAGDGELAERYLHQAARHERRGVLDCGSGAYGEERDNQSGGRQGDEAAAADSRQGSHPTSGLSPLEQQRIKRGVAEEIRRADSENPGSVPAGLERWADQVLEPRVDWRRELAAVVRKAVASTAGAADYTYRKPSRRAPRGSRVLLPSLHKPRPEVAIICDTSDSVSDQLLSMSLAEVEGVLSAIGTRGSVRVLAGDTSFLVVQRIARPSQLVLSGGGGTDMGEGIRRVLGLRPRPTVVIVLTDGFTPWPDEAPKGVRVIVGVLEPFGRDPEDLWPVPRWARRISIRQSALEGSAVVRRAASG